MRTDPDGLWLDEQLIIYPAREPGCAQRQLDSLPIARLDMTNWLEDRLV